MIQRSILIIIATLFFTSVYGQHYLYSQYNYAIQRVNPGAISLSDEASLSSVYRSQSSIQDVELNSIWISAKYPFIKSNNGKRWSSIGMSFEDDRSGLGGIFQTDEIGVTYALNFSTGKYQTLSFGLNVKYKSQKVNSDRLFTGSQFVEDYGFDPDLFSGENLTKYNNNTFSGSTGVIWQMTDKPGQRKVHAGFSIYDFNRPNETFMQNSAHLPATMVFTAGVRVYKNRLMSIYPEAVYNVAHGTKDLTVGALTTYQLGYYNSRLWGQEIVLHTKYLLNEGAMLGVQWENQNFSVGVSYDIPMNNNNVNTGAFEIGFEIKKPIKSKYKAKRKRKSSKKKSSKNLQQQRLNTLHEKSKQEKQVVKAEEKENTESKKPVVTQTNPVESKNIKDEPKVSKVATLDSTGLRKTNMSYSFSFDCSEPNIDAKQFIRSVKDIFKSNSKVKIHIIGHTDNSGPREYNQKLSIERAKYFYDLLLDNGVDKNLIQYSGMGEDKPVNDNSTIDYRRQNRRVEVLIIY